MTPQVKAPNAPPPCSARLMRLPAFGDSGLPPPKARERNSIIGGESLRYPAAVDRVSRTGYRLGRVTARIRVNGADSYKNTRYVQHEFPDNQLRGLVFSARTR